MQRRHTEFFGPDLIRSPVLSGSPEVAAVQVGAALAQLRAPLTRDLAELEAHADLIRGLADRLFPDQASALRLSVDEESDNEVVTTIAVQTTQPMLVRCWLTDAGADAPTLNPPNQVVVLSGTVVQQNPTGTELLLLSPGNGILTIRVTKPGTANYRWAAVLIGRARFSDSLEFRRG